MPSLAQGYGQGLLLGLKLQDAQRERRRSELLDQYRQEQIENWRSSRKIAEKTLLAELKAEQEKAKQAEMLGDIGTVEAGGMKTAPEFMQMIMGGEETPPETKTRLTSMMGYAPWEQKVDEFAGAKKMYPDVDFETLMGLKKAGGVKAVEKAFPGLFPEDLAKPTLPSTWKKAPEKHESEVQKWVTKWHSHAFNNEDYNYLKDEEKKTYFNQWLERVPAELKMEVRRGAEMEVPTARKSIRVKRIATGETTRPEDDFISQAKGRQINWELIQQDHPEWDFEYIFKQLGLK